MDASTPSAAAPARVAFDRIAPVPTPCACSPGRQRIRRQHSCFLGANDDVITSTSLSEILHESKWNTRSSLDSLDAAVCSRRVFVAFLSLGSPNHLLAGSTQSRASTFQPESTGPLSCAMLSVAPPSAAAPPAHGSSLCSYQWPTQSRWARVSIVLLLLSVLQCFTTAYVYQSLDRSFAIAYLAYALSALVMMAFRLKFGLIWFALGGLTYTVWLSVLTWHSIERRDWVRVCFEFTLMTFEILVCLIATSRFHEHGGFTVCCGPPSRDWKGRMLVGASDGREAGLARQLRASSLIDGAELDGVDEPEADRYLHATLLANQYHASVAAYAIPGASQQAHPPREPSAGSLHSGVGGGGPFVDSSASSPLSGSSVEPASHVSPATESYTFHQVGRGEMVYANQLPAAQQQQQQQQHQQVQRSNFAAQ